MAAASTSSPAANWNISAISALPAIKSFFPASENPAKKFAKPCVIVRKAVPATDFSGNTGAGGLWAATPSYHWLQNPAGTSVSFVSAPLKSNTVVFGGGAAQLWIQASTRDVDLQVTISEVRPDGKETFVQNGWVRANERKLDAQKSTRLEPVLSLRGCILGKCCHHGLSGIPRRSMRLSCWLVSAPRGRTSTRLLVA